ncbi:hypothetical protein TKK_0009717 [Trichogramma kaykai]
MIGKFVVLLLLSATIVAAGVPHNLRADSENQYGIFESIGGLLADLQGKINHSLDTGKEAFSKFLDNFKDKREQLAEAAKKTLSDLLEKYEQVKEQVKQFDKRKDAIVALIEEWKAKGEQLVQMSKEQIAELREKVKFILEKQPGSASVQQISAELDKLELVDSLEDLQELVEESVQGNTDNVQLRSAFTDKVSSAAKSLYEKVLDIIKNGSSTVSDLIAKIRVQRVKVVELAKEKLAVLKEQYDLIQEKLEKFVSGNDGILPLVTKFIENTTAFVKESRHLVENLKEKVQEALNDPQHAEHVEEVKEVVEDVKDLEDMGNQLEDVVEQYKSQFLTPKVVNYRRRFFLDVGSLLQNFQDRFAQLHQKLHSGHSLNSIFDDFDEQQEKWIAESDKRFEEAIKKLIEALKNKRQPKEKPEVVEEVKEPEEVKVVEQPEVVEEVKEPEVVQEVKEPEVVEEVKEPEVVEEVKEPEPVEEVQEPQLVEEVQPESDEEVKERPEEEAIKVNELPEEVKEVLQIEEESQQQESREQDLE